MIRYHRRHAGQQIAKGMAQTVSEEVQARDVGAAIDHSRCLFSVGQRVRVLTMGEPVYGVVRDRGVTLGTWVYAVEIKGDSIGVETRYFGNQLQAWSGNA